MTETVQLLALAPEEQKFLEARESMLDAVLRRHGLPPEEPAQPCNPVIRRGGERQPRRLRPRDLLDGGSFP